MEEPTRALESVITLNCAICGSVFYSGEAFPKRQYCLRCLTAFEAGKADQILALVRQEIDKVENPYPDLMNKDAHLHHKVFESAREAIKKALGGVYC